MNFTFSYSALNNYVLGHLVPTSIDKPFSNCLFHILYVIIFFILVLLGRLNEKTTHKHGPDPQCNNEIGPEHMKQDYISRYYTVNMRV